MFILKRFKKPPTRLCFEKLIIEKVDEFLKEMIKWEVPSYKTTLGFHHKEI